MKKFQLVILTTLFTSLLFTSCSKDDDEAPQPEPSLEEVKFALIDGFEEIALPQGVLDSEDKHAKQVVERHEFIQLFHKNHYIHYFTPPANAVKSNTPIVPAEGEYLVYQWVTEDGTLAYQLSKKNDEYLLEAFIKTDEGGNFQKYLEAHQSKDGKKVQVKEVSTDIIIKWERAENGEVYIVYLKDHQKFEQVLHANGSGKQQLFKNNKLESIIQWDAEGKGFWEEYDEEGKKVDSGSWPKPLEEVKLALIDGFEEIALPQGVLDSEDEHAQRLAKFHQEIFYNFRDYITAYFDIPEDAEISNTPVVPAEGEYLVYQWNKEDETIACQVSQQEGEYVLEVFVKEGEAFQKKFEARQSKDGKKLKVIEFQFGKVDYTSTWEEKEDGSTSFLFEDDQGSLEHEVHADGSGNLLFTREGIREYFVQCDAEGNGTWKEFDEKGDILDSGSWSKA
ncbi:hypothetical protein AAG747_14335 [Rapidithrix thailandica]|uniref:Lipoprotein n=1 Tax=Rapidithrix thailandica TaxID=413964 RepID=A0AAW9S6F8_9BACT